MQSPSPSPRVDAEGYTNSITKEFRALLRGLPKEVRKLARARFKQFLQNPAHSSFVKKQLKDKRSSSHLPGSYSVRVSRQYRAIFVIVDRTRRWYWIGSHADYDTYTGG